MTLKKRWKKLPAWLKGGVVGLIVFVVLYALSILLGMIGLLVYALMMWPVLIISYKLGLTGYTGTFEHIRILGEILVILFYFLSGIIIGWIIGKIRSKK